MMRLMLELDEGQENFVVMALMEQATMAWEASMANELDPEPCEEHGPECARFWNEQLAIAESVLGQFSAQVLDSWRHSLGHRCNHDHDDDEADR